MFGYKVIAIITVGIFILIWLFWLTQRQKQIEKRFVQALGGIKSGANLESTLVAYFEKLNITEARLTQMLLQADNLSKLAVRSYQKMGLVRFNPFRDTGGDQSFALCLLDNQDNGLVLTAVHSRQGTRIYAKTIEYGQSASQLSAEEVEALRLARAPKRPKPKKHHKVSRHN